MTQHVPRNVGQAMPEEFFDAIQEMVSGAVVGLRLALASATTVKVPASAGSGQVSIAIDGAIRYVIADVVSPAHPAVGARTSDVHVTALPNQAAPLAGPAGGDHSFAIAFTAAGGAPGGGVISRKIGEVVWSGAAITAIRQTVAVAGHAYRHRVGGEDELPIGAVGSTQLVDAAVTSQKFKPTANVLVATAGVNVPNTGAIVDVPGLSVTLTPAVASVLLVTFSVVVQFTGTNPVVYGWINAGDDKDNPFNGAPNSPPDHFEIQGTGMGTGVVQKAIALAAGVPVTVKARMNQSGGAGSSTASPNAGSGQLSYLLVAA